MSMVMEEGKFPMGSLGMEGLRKTPLKIIMKVKTRIWGNKFPRAFKN